MTLWHEKEIDVTLQSDVRGVSIFPDIECTVLVDYDSEDGEIEWKVTGFKFTNYRDDETTIIKEGDDAVHWAILMSALDESVIEESVASEFSYKQDSDSGHCHSARVTA
jgi:hypothetical protein